MNMKIPKIMLLCIVAALLYMNTHITAADAATSIVNVSLLNQDPDPVGAGDIVELRFMVQNFGSADASNLQLELLLEYPFSSVPGENYIREIPTLRAYQTGDNAITLKYKVRVDSDAVKGTNKIDLRLTSSISGISVTETDTFDVDVAGNEFAQIIYVDKAKLEPGNETPLKFTITNVGNSPLQNLVFSWNEKNGVILPVYSDDTKYIKNIDVGKSVELGYIVVADVNADPGLYQLDLNLKYEAQGGISQEMNTKAGIFIGGETDFDVTFSESSGGQTSLSVANIGNNPALSVTVRIPDQQNFRVSGSSSSIIGNLDRGDYTIVSFQITLSAASAGGLQGTRVSGQTGQRFANFSAANLTARDNNLTVLIEYTDTTGERHSIVKSVPIQYRSDTSGTTSTTSSQQSTLSSYTTYIMLAAVVMAGVIAYRKRNYLRKSLFKRSGKK